MRIDSHQHFWKFDPVRDAWITSDMKILQRDFLPSDLIPLLSENNIDGCVAVQASQSKIETEFLLDLAKATPFIKGVVGWVDILSPNLTRNLDEYVSHKQQLKGFRHIVQSEPYGFLSNAAFADGVKEIGKKGFTYDLLIYHHQLKEALAFVRRVTDVRIVIDHLAKPSIKTGEKTEWELHMSAMSTFENVYCKVSGLVTEANWNSWKKDEIFPFLDEIMETFGPSRMMYGSDWPVCLLAGTYASQLNVVEDYISALSADEQRSIMGGTAVEFYGL